MLGCYLINESLNSNMFLASDPHTLLMTSNHRLLVFYMIFYQPYDHTTKSILKESKKICYFLKNSSNKNKLILF